MSSGAPIGGGGAIGGEGPMGGGGPGGGGGTNPSPVGGVWGVVAPPPCTGGGGGGTGAVMVTDSCEPSDEREWVESSDAMELWWIDEELIVCLLIVPLAGGEFWGRVQFCEGGG